MAERGQPHARELGWGQRLTQNCLSSLVEELKAANPDFPAVSSGIYVQEVVPNSPSQRYARPAEAALRHGGGVCWGLGWASSPTLGDLQVPGKELWGLASLLSHGRDELSLRALATPVLGAEGSFLCEAEAEESLLGPKAVSKPPSLQKELGPQFSYL